MTPWFNRIAAIVYIFVMAMGVYRWDFMQILMGAIGVAVFVHLEDHEDGPT